MLRKDGKVGEKSERKRSESVLPSSLLSFFMLNTRGLYPKCNQNKIPMLKELASEDNSTFLALTETHLSSDIIDAEISIPGYTIFRTDRKDRSHGGVAVYVRDDFAASTEKLAGFSDGTIEFIVLYVKKLDLIIVNLYRPPSSTSESFSKVLDEVEKILKGLPSTNTEFLLLGDFNFPHVKW